MESQSIVNNGRRTRSELKTNWLPSDLSKHPKQGDFNLAERKQYDEQIDAFYKGARLHKLLKRSLPVNILSMTKQRIIPNQYLKSFYYTRAGSYMRFVNF
jgi:hypothetical protein